MDAHEREAAGAAAGMGEVYGYRPQPGDRVRCPKAFGGGYQDGTVHGIDRDGLWLVDTPEGRLRLYLEELERI